MPSIYQVPLLLEQQGLITQLRDVLALQTIAPTPAMEKKGSLTWTHWKSLTSAENRYFDTVSIVLVGKYIELHDAYVSVIKSLEHSAMRCRRKLDIQWVDAEHLEPKAREEDPANFHKAWHNVCTASGILVPGGFGHRGTEGMIAAAKWARENKVPYLGICLGMQIAVIEYARNVCGISGATSEEFDKVAGDQVIMYMPQIDKAALGGTMRLGLHSTLFQPGSEWSRLRALYAGKEEILERHRHRYEVNPAYIETIEKAGLSFVGKDDKGERMEVIEIKDHPWFVAVQFHPEYLSRVLDPSRPYLGFVAASAGLLKELTEEYSVGQGPLDAAEGVTNGVNGIKLDGETGMF